MDSNTQRLLESVAQKTLHSHAFSRASTQATLVLTDLLSRYLALLTSSCSKYAQHAGRRQLSIYDALQAIEELGTSVEELREYGSTEGKEMNRYAVPSARRAEDLNELRSQLFEGLRQDRDDAIPLQFAYRGEQHYEDSDEDASSDSDASEDEDMRTAKTNDMDVDVPQRQKRRMATPPLPPSPISNSPSPSRKRARTANWNPPEHIPDFLPPFPSTEIKPPESRQPSPGLSQQHPHLPPPETSQQEKAEMSLSQAIATTNGSSDILVQVPYSQSTLATLPERHLPGAPPPAPPPRTPRFQTPQIEPSFIGAYHHILTHPAPPHPPPSTSQRHKVAMALLDLVQKSSRWTPADTLHASASPCLPRVASMAPSYPVAITDLGPDGKPRDGKDDKAKLPTTTHRTVSYPERLAPMVSQPSSHIPNLARHVLHPTILHRTTRLLHPGVLYRGSKPLVYGNGVAAPWNVAPLPSADTTVPATPSTAKSHRDKDKDKDKEYHPNGALKDKDFKERDRDPDAPKPAMPDARLFATWEFDAKDYRTPMTRVRTRVGSFQAGGGGGSGVITLPNVSGRHGKGSK